MAFVINKVLLTKWTQILGYRLFGVINTAPYLEARYS